MDGPVLETRPSLAYPSIPRFKASKRQFSQNVRRFTTHTPLLIHPLLYVLNTHHAAARPSGSQVRGFLCDDEARPKNPFFLFSKEGVSLQLANGAGGGPIGHWASETNFAENVFDASCVLSRKGVSRRGGHFDLCNNTFPFLRLDEGVSRVCEGQIWTIPPRMMTEMEEEIMGT